MSRNVKEQVIDLDISHHQIHIWSGGFDEENQKWGKKNLKQGAIINSSHATFDPIVDGRFVAKVYFRVRNNFEIDKSCLRVIQFPFKASGEGLFLSSVSTKHKLVFQNNNSSYDGYFEICEKDEIDEVYFIITLVESDTICVSQFLVSDPWGGKEGKKLILGNA